MNIKINRHLTRSAFTLVELLVVIGIIAVLIAILFPALSRAREHANRIKCLATLRTMGQAAQMHAIEHRGHMPLAGPLPVAIYPDAIGDVPMKKYTYFLNSANHGDDNAPGFAPAPLSASLGQYMGLPVVFGTRQELQDSMRSELVVRHFICPSDRAPTTGSTISCVAGWTGPADTMSYMFNAYVLGLIRDPYYGDGIGGKASRVRRPADVFLFADGRSGDGSIAGFAVGNAETLLDYWLRHGGNGRSAFPTIDPDRHRNVFNVVFVDGHAESVLMPPKPPTSDTDPHYPGELKRVGVSSGIFN